jgi:hypothetical protein
VCNDPFNNRRRRRRALRIVEHEMLRGSDHSNVILSHSLPDTCGLFESSTSLGELAFACTDLSSDWQNCGSYGNVCPTYQCASGNCCPEYMIACGDDCHFTNNDTSNCGYCGNICTGPCKFCYAGRCDNCDKPGWE